MGLGEPTTAVEGLGIGLSGRLGVGDAGDGERLVAGEGETRGAVLNVPMFAALSVREPA